MKIGIISDTHGGLKAWEEAMKGPLGDVELILHAGDLLYHGPRNPFPKDYDPQTLAWAINHAHAPLLIARGNCDAEVDQLLINFPLMSPYVYCMVDGIAVLMLHGEDQEPEDLRALGERYQVNLLISGHTHRPYLLEKGPLVLLNPGSPALPKDAPPTMALLETEQKRVTLLDLEGEVLQEVTLRV